MKRTFFYNTLILTFTSQALRVVGIFFIAFLSGQIGTEGVGLYQLIISIFILAATMATSGLGISVTRITAEAMGKSGGKSTVNVLRHCVKYGLCLSLIVGVLLFWSADFIGTTILNDPRTVLSLKILAPSLPFMTVSVCLRGYFYARRKVLKPASEMLLGQTVQILIIVAIIHNFIPKGLEYACASVIFAAAASEVFSCVYSFVLYRFERRKSHIPTVRDPEVKKKIFRIFVPVAASSYLRSGLRTAENVLIPLGLKNYGASHKDALSQYGLLIGMVMPLLLFPSSLLSAVATLLVPEISEAYAVDNREKVRNTVSRVFRLTLLLSLLFCGIFIFFAKDIGLAIYNNLQAGGLLMLLAPLIPLIYLDFVVDGMMNALNQQVKTLKINILDYSLRILLIFIFVPMFGLTAFICIFYTSTILNASLSIYWLVRTSNIHVLPGEWIFKPLLCVLCAASLVKLLFRLFPGVSLGITLTLEIILTAALYLLFLFLIEVLTKKDVVWFKAQVKRPDPPRVADIEGV